MKCFYRNETLHKSEPLGVSQHCNSRSAKELERGTAYARHHLEGRNSLFEGCHHVCFTLPSQFHHCCGCAGWSRLWRLQQLDQSTFQSEASCADVDGAEFLLFAYERHQGQGSEVGITTFPRRAECFSTHRSGGRYVVAPRVRLYDGYSGRCAGLTDEDNSRLQGRIARSLRDAATRSAVSATRDRGSGSSEHGDLWN